MIKDGVMIYCEECSSHTCGCPEAKEIESLRQQLASRDAEIAELRQTLIDHVEIQTALREQLAIRDAEIATLREQVDEKETQRQSLMAVYERQGNSAQEVITKLRKQVKMLRDVVSAPFVEWIRAQYNLTYKHGVDIDFPQSASGIWLDDVYEALAATEPKP